MLKDPEAIIQRTQHQFKEMFFDKTSLHNYGIEVKENAIDTYNADKLSICVLNPDTAARICFKDLEVGKQLKLDKTASKETSLEWDYEDVDRQLKKDAQKDLKPHFSKEKYFGPASFFSLMTGAAVFTARQGDRVKVLFNPHDFKVKSVVSEIDDAAY